jgi:hypothetical protein
VNNTKGDAVDRVSELISLGRWVEQHPMALRYPKGFQADTYQKHGRGRHPVVVTFLLQYHDFILKYGAEMDWELTERLVLLRNKLMAGYE